MSEPVIEVRLSGRLGGFALDAAFSAPAAGVTALFGPSGSGKTSLLRCIAGLARAPGVVRFRGELWQDERRFTAPHRRGVGYVFQEPSLFAHLSVRQNLVFGLARRAGAGAGPGFEEVVELLAIGPLLDRSPARLSGGEQQRVAIGRALLAAPKLLLMDEPLSSLDRDARLEILPYVERLRRDAAVPMIYVSHDAFEIARLADRVLLMQGGRIVGPPAAPATLAPRSEPDARQALAASDEDRTARLALAALLAGLKPHGERQDSSR